jgi:hypothetical protein
MCTLANLTNEECHLLVELLEREQRELRLRTRSVPSPAGHEDASRRQDILERLLWNARLACSTRKPDDAELREIGGYY